MEVSQAEGILGLCSKCGKCVFSNGSGCTAKNKVYHNDCFTCHECNTNLKGVKYYVLEGILYCNLHYLSKLEKCLKCCEPISKEISRVAGKSYHPECLICVVCETSLANQNFNFDADNKLYCLNDFHKKFAPRCCVCSLPIMTPEGGTSETVVVQAFGKNFHVSCYKCEDCGNFLSISNGVHGHGQSCSPLGDRILCRKCFLKRVQL